MPVDLFQRITITGAGGALNMSVGVAGSDSGNPADQLIQLLEQTIGPGLQAARAAPLPNAAPPFTPTTVNIIDEGFFWAMSTAQDFPIVTEQVTDVTDVSGGEFSGQYIAFDSYGGITVKT